MSKKNTYSKMDLHSHNIDQTLKYIDNWLTSVKVSGTWEDFDLHIDELPSFEGIDRSAWTESALYVLSQIETQNSWFNKFRLFLHFDLREHSCEIEIGELSLDWLNNNLNEFTPPSFHVTSLEYFNAFYKAELIPCKPSNDILKLIPFEDLSFYYRNYYESSEEVYFPEVYVFVNV